MARLALAPLFITQFLGTFNDNVYKYAITFEFNADAEGSGAYLVTSDARIFVLPFFLFSALTGQLGGKHEQSIG